MQLPRLQSVNNSTTSSVVNVNVLASVDVESLESDRTSNYNGRINQKEQIQMPKIMIDHY